MPLWGNKDFATGNNKPKYANTASVFGIDVSEQQQSVTSATDRPTHAGWVEKTVGSGGRSGRVFYETLVAMGSISEDASNVTLPQQTIVVASGPTNATANSTSSEHAYFSVSASLVPTGGSITYQWQANTAPLSDDSVYANTNTATLDVKDATGLNGTQYRVVLSKAGATTVTTANATLTVTT